ncbi:MAG: DUF2281 domain-containing protein [Cyanobacteria bacterium J06659_2]
MSPQLQKVLNEIEQLSAEEQLEVISYATEQLKRRTAVNPVWQAYQTSKQERQEVYRRLADA